MADSAASLVGLTPAGEAGQRSQAEAAASSMSAAADARTGELAVVPPMLGISQRLLHRDHHKVYYEVSQLCSCRAGGRNRLAVAAQVVPRSLTASAWVGAEARLPPLMSACRAGSCPFCLACRWLLE